LVLVQKINTSGVQYLKGQKDVHEKLLNLIALLDENTAGSRIIMTVDLRQGVIAPSIGPAIAEIIIFGQFDQQKNQLPRQLGRL
jgi:hypothetical protein